RTGVGESLAGAKRERAIANHGATRIGVGAREGDGAGSGFREGAGAAEDGGDRARLNIEGSAAERAGARDGAGQERHGVDRLSGTAQRERAAAHSDCAGVCEPLAGAKSEYATADGRPAGVGRGAGKRECAVALLEQSPIALDYVAICEGV